MSRFKPIPIRVYHATTLAYLGSYASFHQFRKPRKLRKLHLGNKDGDGRLLTGAAIRINNFFICKKGVVFTSALNKYYEKKHRKENVLREKQLQNTRKRNQALAKSIILTLKPDFSIKSIYIGPLDKLAKKEKMDVGNLKSKLSRAARFIKNYFEKPQRRKSFRGKHYMYLIDYIK